MRDGAIIPFGDSDGRHDRGFSERPTIGKSNSANALRIRDIQGETGTVC